MANLDEIDIPAAYCPAHGLLRPSEVKQAGEDAEGFPIQVCSKCGGDIDWE